MHQCHQKYFKVIQLPLFKQTQIRGSLNMFPEFFVWALLNSLRHGWSYRIVHCPGGNATPPIWRVLASSDGISFWTPLKPQHNNSSPKPLVSQLPYSSQTSHHPSQTLCFPWISYTTQKLMQDGRKAVWSIPYVSVASFFPSLKKTNIAYRSSKMSWRPDCIFEIHQLWQSGFSRVYSNCCCICSFEPEIIKIGQSSHTMYINNIVNFQVSTTIVNACTKSLETYWMHHV